MNYDGLLPRCLEKEDVERVLRELHDALAGGNFARETIVHKILREGYYWPTFFRDAHAHVRKQKFCQLSVVREKKASIPLQLVIISRPLEQWGIDVIGEINPNSSNKHKYILTMTNYFM